MYTFVNTALFTPIKKKKSVRKGEKNNEKEKSENNVRRNERKKCM